YDLTPRDRIGLFTFGSFDFLSSTEDDIETVIFGQEFYRADLRYDRKMPNGGFLRAAVTAGFDQTRLFASRNSQNFLYGSRMRVTQPVRDDLTVRAGVDMTVDNYQATAPRFADPDNPGLQRFDDLFPPRSDNAMALWADVVWKVNPRFEITPGLRYDQYISQGAFGASVDPRISAVTKVHPRIRLLQAAGLANQPPSFSVPLPGFAVASLRGGLQRSVQLSSGIEGKLPYEVTATVTGFTNAFFNLTDALGSQVDPTDPTLPRSLGSTKGLEIYIRRSLAKRFGGFVSYTLSRTTRSVGRERLVATFDRTHVLNSGVGYNLGGGWKTGLRFSVFSGTPTAPIPADSPPGTQLRDPAFYRLDFRAEKRWKIAETGFISFVAEMINITLNREVIAGEPLPPVTVPSLGLEGGF
ncbi:MAG: TonB-dependent receptor, partial [Myxococcota bacterium]